MIKKYKEYYDKLNEETGIKNIKQIVSDQIANDGNECEIWFHMDTDGVYSAIAMREYLKRYGLELVDSHIIQYGGIEFAIKEKKPGTLAALVDYAHSKTFFKIATDHHDKQTGVEKGQSTHFRHSRSNSETISGVISPTDIFGDTDIELIKAVDSADFLKHELKPEDIQRAVFSYDKEKTPTRNRFLMGLVVNRLLLAFKNKRITVTSLNGKNHHVNKNLLECLVLDAAPSLYSLFLNIKHYVNNAISLEYDRKERSHQSQKKLITPEELNTNLQKYIKSRSVINGPEGENSFVIKDNNVEFDEEYKIVSQYGIGYVIPTGSYDRYVIFKNYPEAEFVCTIFPMGLIQVSCNPFKEKALKDINLGAIAKEVLGHYKYQFSNINIPLSDIKRLNEMEIKKMRSKYGDEYTGLGFKFADLKASYSKSIVYMPNFKQGDTKTIAKLDLTNDEDPIVKFLQKWIDVPFEQWPNEIKERLNNLKIPIWDIIAESSGGHPSITNIQGLNYLSCRRDLLKILFKTDDWLVVMKDIAQRFITTLKEKIDIARAGKEVEYIENGVELHGGINNESIEYFINDENDIRQVTKDEFLEFGMDTNFEPKRDSEKGFKVNITDNKIVGYYEKLIN